MSSSLTMLTAGWDQRLLSMSKHLWTPSLLRCTCFGPENHSPKRSDLRYSLSNDRLDKLKQVSKTQRICMFVCVDLRPVQRWLVIALAISYYTLFDLWSNLFFIECCLQIESASKATHNHNLSLEGMSASQPWIRIMSTLYNSLRAGQQFDECIM